jgi:hypothetical protein
MHEIISQATRAGFIVYHDEKIGGWWIRTPKRPRRPSQELGTFKDERTAWMDAALLASQDD